MAQVTDVDSALTVSAKLSHDRAVAEFTVDGATLHDWGFTMALRADFDSDTQERATVQAAHISENVAEIHQLLPRYFRGRGLASYGPSSVRVRSTRPIDAKTVECVRLRIEEILTSY